MSSVLTLARLQSSALAALAHTSATCYTQSLEYHKILVDRKLRDGELPIPTKEQLCAFINDPKGLVEVTRLKALYGIVSGDSDGKKN